MMSTFMHTFRDCSSEIGDYIGTESCIDLKDSQGEEKEVKSKPLKDVDERGGRGRLNRSESAVRRQKREFPPPIPLLARTENLWPHMPWTLKRYYSGDGRLIIKEVRVRHHDYFRVNRFGGRLTLDLIPLDDAFLPLGLGIHEEEEDESDEGIEEGNADAALEEADAEEPLMNKTVVEEESEIGTDDPSEIHLPVEEENAKLPMVGGGGVECWNYSGGNQNGSCFFKVNLPSIRPVQI